MSCEYNPQVLHMPTDLIGPKGDVAALLNSQFKVEMQDGRIYIGIFCAYDKFGNLVLNDVEEMFQGQTRKTSMIVIPLRSIKAISKRPLPQKEHGN